MVTLAREHVEEVLVVDDGSADGTADVARAAGAGGEAGGKAALL